MDELPSIDPNVDYTQILPIQQKRTVAFVNHFIMSTVSFFKHFAKSCESRLMEFEYKLEKVEASLIILETQLASIPNLKDEIKVEKESITLDLPQVEKNNNDSEEISDNTDSQELNQEPAEVHPELKRFLKMIQVGVPLEAVKLKMKSEGINSSLIDEIIN